MTAMHITPELPESRVRLSPSRLRPRGRLLVAAASALLARQGLPVPPDIRERLAAVVDAAGIEAIARLSSRLDEPREWDWRPADPLARQLLETFSDVVLLPDSTLVGSERLQVVGDAPLILFGNHLSYADANLLALMLLRHGQSALVDRLTVVAGPKVFADRARRFSSLCFGTIRVPQSGDVASEEAVLPAREIARASRQVIDLALQRLAMDDALLVFAEGTRSRSGGMQRLLPAVARYLEAPGAWVVPVGLTGAERLLPVAGGRIDPATVAAHIGDPMPALALLAATDDRRVVMDAIGLAIAGQLPEAYRGVYRDLGDFGPARAVLSAVSTD